MTPRERNALRARILADIYAAVDGSTDQNFYPEDFVNDVNQDERRKAFDWLRDNGYIEGRSLAGDYELTPSGVNEAERVLEEREASGTADEVLEGDGLYLVVLSPEAKAAVEALLSEIDRADPESRMKGDDLASYEADRRTVAAQMSSPTPRKRTVRDGLRNMLRALRSLGVEISSTVVLKAMKLD